MSIVGASVLRVEDLPLLRGEGSYVADLNRDGQLHARVVRSPVAHGRIVAIETTAAAGRDDVAAVVTAADVPEIFIPIRLSIFETPEGKRALQPVLARDRVRYVGEPVAVVVATDPYAAEDAAEQVLVEVEPAEPVVDALAAEAAPPLHETLGGNVVNRIPMVCGDVGAAFADADIVIRERFRVHRHTAVPLETRGLLAEPDPATGRLTVWGAAKVKDFYRQALSQMLAIDPGQVRVVEADVGGGFGVRGEFYPEDFLVPWLALRLGRPVKWIEDRHEHFVATNHSREQEQEIEVAAMRDGTLLAFRARLTSDLGAYVRTTGILLPLVAADHLPGPYRWRAFSVEATAVLTTKTPAGTYRAPGVTEATFLRERMVDVVAHELAIDPVDLRRRNLIDSLPWTFDRGPTVHPIVYETGDFRESFDTLLREAGYDELRRQRRRGVGVSCFVELGGLGPFERARIVPEADGGYTVQVGVASVGQGLRTVLGQIAAEALGVELERVTIAHHDTDVGPEGFGTFASRSTVLAGNAILLAAADLERKRADGVERPVGEATFEKKTPSFSFGANLSLVSLDEETGAVTPLRHVIAFDVGRAVNPLLVRGQLAGAVAQGIAGVLLEELVYDENAQPLATSLMDYLLPTASELPEVEIILLEYPVPGNPLGVKGAGEAGVPGAFAAVANAVADALGEAGTRVTRLPLTPDAVLAILSEPSAQ